MVFIYDEVEGVPNELFDQALVWAKESRFLMTKQKKVEQTAEEKEFQEALHRYKKENKRPNPTSDEVLAVLKTLGYRKATDGSR